MFAVKQRTFNRWVREYHPFLFRAAWALTGSRQDAEEMVQDTFELAWRHYDQLKDQDRVRAWLYWILRHECLRAIRTASETTPWNDACENLVFIDHKTELRLDLLWALQQLSPMHREILVLYYLEDVSYAEMAEALEIAPGTVMSRLGRARIELRRLLEEDISHERTGTGRQPAVR
jgi:RNA polymerase sigma factor (sigma-70 family)